MASRVTCKPCAKVVLRNPIRAALANAARFGVGFRPYRCPHGNGWHLTTRPARKAAA